MMNAYWLLEYGKVFVGYIFLMFIWPTFVFRKHLRTKSKVYHFSFCVTVQIVIINLVVLVLGLFNLLNRKVVTCLFYSIFFVAILKLACEGNYRINLEQLYSFKMKIWMQIQKLRDDFHSKIGEYSLLLLILIFGVTYFSYGAFQVHTYGCYDVFIHHGWVNEMTKGKIFPDGIYPMAMHAFIYCLNALFGIRIYSIMLFLQCIHIMTFLLSAYCLLREIFAWRYSPVFTITLFLVINVNSYHGMYRLPLTLPMEFGLHTQFLCALFLIRYLKNTGSILKKRKNSKFFWDADLLVFMMALAASIATHYYTTIMAAVMCIFFVLFNIKKIFNPKYLIPLIISVSFGCLISILPMAGALISGIPFQGSIRWGLNMINNNSTDIVTSSDSADTDTEIANGILEPTSEDWEVIDRLPDSLQGAVKNIIKAEYLLKATYKYGYQGTFQQERGMRIFWITISVALFCIICRLFSWEYLKRISSMYFPIILISFVSMLIYAAYASPELGLPVIIPNHRFCPEGFLMVFAVMMMPADILFSLGTCYFNECFIRRLSYVFTIGLYVLMNILGNFHEYLFYSLTRYDSAALVTNSIIDEFVCGSYTIISPSEEMYQVEPYGGHEEISDFLNKCEGKYYSLPTKYIFIYVEKRPIEYYQDYYFSGPSWLAKSRKSEIKSTEISKEAAQGELSGYINASWNLYMNARTTLQSKAYEWCQSFSERFPSKLNVYYEDEEFVCYYFKQDVAKPYNLAGE